MTTMISHNFSRKDFTPEHSELFEGIVEVNIAAPFSNVQLLQVMRHLQDQNIEIRQTAGSWKTGIVITAFMEEPLPLADILGETPNVADVRVINRQMQSSVRQGKDSLAALVSGRSSLSRISIAVN